MIMGGRDGSGGSVDLGRYVAYDGPSLGSALPVESLERLSFVRPAPRLPAGPGRCRRPVEGSVAGYAVERVAALPVAAGQMLTDDDLVPWEVGEPVNVYPLRPLSACGRCWACRLPRVARVVELGGRVVAAVRRRNVTVAVAVLMVVPALVMLVVRFGAGRWF